MKLKAHIRMNDLLQSCAAHSILHSKEWYLMTHTGLSSELLKLVVWWGWEHGPAVKSTGWSTDDKDSVPKIHLVELSVTIVPRAPTLPSDLHDTALDQQTLIHTKNNFRKISGMSIWACYYSK